jgi:hypothetical protein
VRTSGDRCALPTRRRMRGRPARVPGPVELPTTTPLALLLAVGIGLVLSASARNKPALRDKLRPREPMLEGVEPRRAPRAPELVVELALALALRVEAVPSRRLRRGGRGTVARVGAGPEVRVCAVGNVGIGESAGM